VTTAPLQVTVRAIAAGGDGVATLPDGRTVFIPRAAPGDRVVLRNVRLHARFARAEIAEVIEPGTDRVMPPCVHYIADRCGGCQLMHLSPEAQRAVKGRIVGDAFRRIARLDIADPEVMPAPADFGYRAKVTFTLRSGRIMGYHQVHDASSVFDVHECLIADDEVRALHAALRSARRYLPRDNARVVLRIDRTHVPHVLVLSEPGDAWTGAQPLHLALQGRGVNAVVWWRPGGGQPRVVAGADTPWPVTVFEQVHPAMGAIVRGAALDALGAVAGLEVWDLYAGIGESTAELAARGATVDSVESDTRAVSVAESLGPPGPRRHEGLVEDLAGRLPRPQLVLANPPRTGMAPRATDAVALSAAGRVAYVSCDPATLARDVARMGSAYRLAGLRAFDQFPQTAHVECLAVLERR
jgi:23S rRNA (uracil1939-C5)-methyltransferase